MEDVKSNSGQNLGIAALITGIITFVLAVIPCVGLIAIIPGIITIVLAVVGLTQASRSDSPRGMMIAGLVIGIIAVMISFSQIFVAGRIARHSGNWSEEIRSAIEEVKSDVIRDIKDNSVSIKIESNGDTVEINAITKGRDRKVKQLEDLEGEKTEKDDTLNKTK